MLRWFNAFRLRTLPVAFSCIITGNGLALGEGKFSALVFVLALMTTVFLQILSNLANDYGDYTKGVDNDDRIGPLRSLQSGLINKKEMIHAMWVVSFLCSISGVSLIYYGTLGLNTVKIALFCFLGLSAMFAAMKYTMGKNPYGYSGFGDLFVFLFFGWLGVFGSYFLQTHSMDLILFLPASSIGFFTAAVLNINNMRDHKGDKESNKNTLVVKMGLANAKKYQILINSLGILLMFIFLIPHPSSILMLIIGVLLFIKPAISLLKSYDYTTFDPYLKKQAIATFLFSILFVVSVIL
ncbi:MAG: 1,4-dihydroxy-2-naphthoate octaprenyltransferase [Candidatus Neomarinimicrobiota bacterium]|tara:strand:- start:1096 stop:1983 length:888 start_codon:yes stop_codon:yes gene_type:complete